MKKNHRGAPSARWLGWLLMLALVSLGRPAWAGKLGDARASTSKHSSDSKDDGDDDDDDDDGIVASLLLAIIRGDDDDEPPPDRYDEPAPTRERQEPSPDAWFFAYPYADGQQGSMLLLTPWVDRQSELSAPSNCPPDDLACVDTAAPCTTTPCDEFVDRSSGYDLPEGLRRKAGRLQLFSDFGTDIDGLQRYSLGARIESRNQFGFESRWSYWREPLDDGSVDALVFADFTPFLRIVQTRRVQAYLGAGLHVMFDPSRADNAYGFQGSFSLEAYPLKPLAVNVALDAGNLGPVAFADAQASLGAMLGRFELFAGGHFMLVDKTVFAGPLGGIRLHL